MTVTREHVTAMSSSYGTACNGSNSNCTSSTPVAVKMQRSYLFLSQLLLTISWGLELIATPSINSISDSSEIRKGRISLITHIGALALRIWQAEWLPVYQHRFGVTEYNLVGYAGLHFSLYTLQYMQATSCTVSWVAVVYGFARTPIDGFNYNRGLSYNSSPYISSGQAVYPHCLGGD